MTNHYVACTGLLVAEKETTVKTNVRPNSLSTNTYCSNEMGSQTKLVSSKGFRTPLVGSGATQVAIDFTVVLATPAVEKTIGILTLVRRGGVQGL